MRKKLGKTLIAGMMSISMLITQMSSGTVFSNAATVQSAEDWKGIWGVYRILNEGQERPESFDEFLSKSWRFAGRGYINYRETICGDVDTVTAMIKENSVEVEEIEANLE